MERFVGVEEARGRLGQLADEVSSGGEPVVLSKRGQAVAVLLGREEYAQFKEAEAREARAELDQRLRKTRKRVKEAGLEPSVVDEAIEAARRLP